MKKTFFEFICQWRNGQWIEFTPIGLSFEYDKENPSISITAALMGFGFSFSFICPWETDESREVQRWIEEYAGILRLDEGQEDVEPISKEDTV